MIAALVVGCDHHDLNATAEATRRLTPSASIYVAVPPDGRFDTMVYAGSGRTTARLIADAFARRLNRVERAADTRSREHALAEARARDAAYLVLPTILRWEDRATGWSGMADVAEICLAVIDTRSGNAADIAVLRGLGDPGHGAASRPEDLLPRPLAAYVDRLLSDRAVAMPAGLVRDSAPR